MKNAEDIRIIKFKFYLDSEANQPHSETFIIYQNALSG